MLARVEGKSIKLFTRNGNDWTSKLGVLHKALLKMKLPDGWYDGEIVVHDENGRPNFGMLQLAFDGSDTAEIVYFLFDVPYLNGYDLREVPLEARRAALKNVLDKLPSEVVRFSDEFGTDPQELVAAACKMGLEGVIGKRRDSRYVQRRSPDWIKLKCGQRQEFVIGGYTDPQGSRTGIGALLLGTYDKDGVLQYAGNVGSGFNEASLRDLKARLGKLDTDESPFPPKAVAGRKHHWVKPTLIAEVSFAEWTASGSVRHAVFQGLRDDKPAKGITRETAKHVEDVVDKQTEPAAPEGKLPASLKITNGDRVIDKQSGATKLDLVRYYALVGALMMEHLKGRPVSLVRAPAGVGGELFFQKHADVGKLPGVKQMDQALDPDHPSMLEIGSVDGILSAAQWNVVEFHTQNAVGKAYETPNRMVFDLDPGRGCRVEDDAGGGAADARLPRRAGPAVVPENQRRQGPARGGAGQAGLRLGYGQGFLARRSCATWRTPCRTASPSRAGRATGSARSSSITCATDAGRPRRAPGRRGSRPGLGISVPLAWDELAAVKAGDQWNVHNAHTRLDKGNEPWAGYAKSGAQPGCGDEENGVRAAEIAQC